MTEKQFKVTNISENGNTGLFWIGKDNLSVYDIVRLLNELNEENQRLTDKLNQTALELVDEVISQGKAVEISEMSYNEFLDYRAKNGKPMELQL